jgi:hypothetical protein
VRNSAHFGATGYYTLMAESGSQRIHWWKKQDSNPRSPMEARQNVGRRDCRRDRTACSGGTTC